MSNASEEQFEKRFTFEERKSEAERIRLKYPDRIPIIVNIAAGDKSLPALDKKKYLVPQELTASQFLYVIRKRMKIPAEKGIFIFADKHVIQMSQIMLKIYNEHKAADGFVYFTIAAENTFGGEQ